MVESKDLELCACLGAGQLEAQCQPAASQCHKGASGAAVMQDLHCAGGDVDTNAACSCQRGPQQHLRSHATLPTTAQWPSSTLSLPIDFSTRTPQHCLLALCQLSAAPAAAPWHLRQQGQVVALCHQQAEAEPVGAGRGGGHGPRSACSLHRAGCSMGGPPQVGSKQARAIAVTSILQPRQVNGLSLTQLR